MKDASIILHDFQVTINGIPLFEPVSITLSQGDCLHLKGANGIGKTKTLEALVGLHQQTHGQLEFTDYILASDISYIGLKHPFDDHKSVRENLLFWQSLQSKCTDAPFEERLFQFVDNILDKLFGSLSAGQKQRVNLSRLFLNPNRLWILDEPFLYLDESWKKHLEKEISLFCNSGGICVFTSHEDVSRSLKNDLKIIEKILKTPSYYTASNNAKHQQRTKNQNSKQRCSI